MKMAKAVVASVPQILQRGAIGRYGETPKEAIKDVRLNITIPQDELEKIDDYAKAHSMSRSGLIQAAAREYMRA